MIVDIIYPRVFLITPLKDARQQFCICASSALLSRGNFVHLDQSRPPDWQRAEEVLTRLMSKKPFPHESVMEHSGITLELECSRVVSHQLVRHRIASYTQASTRYISYSKVEPAVIDPTLSSNLVAYMHDENGVLEFHNVPEKEQNLFSTMFSAIKAYEAELANGRKIEQARYLLPGALATQIRMTANFRTFRHVVEQRIQKAAAPEIRFLFLLVKDVLDKISPVICNGIVIPS